MFVDEDDCDYWATWAVLILPFMERSNLADQVDVVCFKPLIMITLAPDGPQTQRKL